MIACLPRLEAHQVVEEHEGEAIGQRVPNLTEMLRLCCACGGRGLAQKAMDDPLKLLHERRRGVEQSALQHPHALKDVGRTERDHEARQEDAHVDVLWRKRTWWAAVTQCAQQMHALEHRLGNADRLLLS